MKNKRTKRIIIQKCTEQTGGFLKRSKWATARDKLKVHFQINVITFVFFKCFHKVKNFLFKYVHKIVK